VILNLAASGRFSSDRTIFERIISNGIKRIAINTGGHVRFG
jgi:hypothetical protein